MPSLKTFPQTLIAAALALAAAASPSPPSAAEITKGITSILCAVENGAPRAANNTTAAPAQPVNDLHIVVARHVMICENRITTWEALEKRIADHAGSGGLRPHYYLTLGALREVQGLSDEVKAKALELSGKYPFARFLNLGYLGTRASARYDAIRNPSDLVPDENLRISGRVTSAAGNPAIGAEVILCSGIESVFDIYVTGGKLYNRMQEVVADTDMEGRFSVFPPRGAPYVLLVLHPEGALLAGSDTFSSVGVLTLQPWSELEVSLEEDSRFDQAVGVRFTPPDRAGWPRIRIHALGRAATGPDQPHRFKVPTPGKVLIQRRIEGAQGVSLAVPGAQMEIETNPGTRHAVKLARLTTDELAQLDRLRESYSFFQEKLKPGAAAPEFEVVTLEGGPLRLSDFKGKFVLLDFWATWCAPCIREKPFLKAVHARFAGDERFVIISLSLDDEAEAPRRFVGREDLKWLQAHVPGAFSHPITGAYQVSGIPCFWLIGPDGRIVARVANGREAEETVARFLEAAPAKAP